MKIEKIGYILAEMGALLIGSGANSPRAKRNVQRVGEALGYHVETFFTQSVVIVNIQNKKTKESFNTIKNISHLGVNFAIVSKLSILSWKVVEKKLSIDELPQIIDAIKNTKHYTNWIVWLMIGFATAALCRIFGGEWSSVLITFLASSISLFIRQKIQQQKVNLFICWLIGSFCSVTIVLLGQVLFAININEALAACVLWLIPGVPLINAFIDILEGHVVSGTARGMLGTMMIFMIAIGFFISLYIFGYTMKTFEIHSDISIPERIICAALVSLGFAILFVTPKRALWAVALLGIIGYMTKFILLEHLTIFEKQTVVVTFISACITGLLSIYLAHRVHTPPVVFSIPAVINMIPGKMGYEFMFNLLKIISLKNISTVNYNLIFDTLSNGLKIGFICFGLAFGVALPSLLYKSQSVKRKI